MGVVTNRVSIRVTRRDRAECRNRTLELAVTQLRIALGNNGEPVIGLERIERGWRLAQETPLLLSRSRQARPPQGLKAPSSTALYSRPGAVTVPRLPLRLVSNE